MEIFQELFFTVVISLGLAFLIAKLVSAASAGNEEQETLSRSGKEKEEIDEKVVMEERSFVGELKNTGLEIEKRVEFIKEALVVDKIEGDLVTKGSSLEIVQDGGEILKEEVGMIEHKDEGREEKVEEDEQEEEEVNNVGLEEKSVKESCCKDEEEEEMKGGKSPEETDQRKISPEDGGLEENLVVERAEKVEVHEIGLELAKEEQIISQDEQIGVDENENNQKNEIGVEKSRTDCLFSDEEDWEGIERSEVENIFGAASTFVSSGDNNELLSKLGSDVQMQLYGLHKVATEGPCYEPQPLALMVSSRAKWHAWQRLGNMSPEVAMEQYTALLSESIPGWMGRNPEGESKQDKSNDSPEPEVSGKKDHNLSSFLHHQPVSEDERKPGDHSFGDGGDGTGATKNL